jgi:hypothetical protein
MNKWVRRGAVTLTVMVAVASAAFVTLAELGDRKLHRPSTSPSRRSR